MLVNKRSKYIIISILLHGLLLLLIQFDKNFLFPEKLEKKQEDRLVFELIETPRSESDVVPETNIASDKNVTASDLNDSNLSKNDLPFQEGETSLKTFNEKKINESNDIAESKQEPISDILADINKNKTSFYEDYKTRQKEQQLSAKMDYDQEFTDVLEKGGIKFNTYKWDFAPYLLSMKKKVESHINPPYAFTRLGAIDGNTLVRFKIMQDGSLENLEILGSDAHSSLDITSTNAIKFSAPFRHLPGNFPEPYLEVTALFSYLIRNSRKK